MAQPLAAAETADCAAVAWPSAWLQVGVPVLPGLVEGGPWSWDGHEVARDVRGLRPRTGLAHARRLLQTGCRLRGGRVQLPLVGHDGILQPGHLLGVRPGPPRAGRGRRGRGGGGRPSAGPDDSAPDVELEGADAVVVSLASALASVAVADASVAWAEITVALRSATSSDARVWPAVTVWPTDTSTG